MLRALLLGGIFVVSLLPFTSNFAQDGAAQAVSAGNIGGVLSKIGNVPGRGKLGDGQESIDTFSGILQLQYTDATIPGDGGFDLPIIRNYSSPQYFNDDTTNRIFGRRWDIHFGRIQSNLVENLSRNYCTNSTLATLYSDDRFNPVFQAPDGSSHKLYVANSGDLGASDGISKARHRVTCNNDGTVLIEDRNGLKYYFGKQDYYRQGNGLQWADIFMNTELLVEYDNYLYVTRI